MATYTLTGTGVQVLTGGTTRLFITVIAYPPKYGFGRANPENLYDIGQLRLGITDFYYPVQSIDAVQMVMDVPPDVTELGYSLFGPASITVAEDTPPPPPGAEVHTSVDGTSIVLGTYLDVIWSGIVAPDVTDRVTIQPVTATDATDRACFTSFDIVYTSSGTNTPGGVALASGSINGQSMFTGDFTDPYQARLYFAGSDTDFIAGPDFTITSG